MTSAKTIDGKAVHFPGTLIVDSTSVIEPPPQDVLPEIAASIAPDELLLFAKRLVNSARKKRNSVRWSKVNRARLELAALCLERALDDMASSE
jgi:hypothetical protein